mgnify:FL=1
MRNTPLIKLTFFYVENFANIFYNHSFLLTFYYL